VLSLIIRATLTCVLTCMYLHCPSAYHFHLPRLPVNENALPTKLPISSIKPYSPTIERPSLTCRPNTLFSDDNQFPGNYPVFHFPFLLSLLLLEADSFSCGNDQLLFTLGSPCFCHLLGHQQCRPLFG